MVHIYNEMLLSHKKEWNNAICTNMVGPRGYQTKWSQSDRERQILYDVTYMWNLKNNTNEYTKQKQTHRLRKQTYGYQRGKVGRGIN